MAADGRMERGGVAPVPITCMIYFTFFRFLNYTWSLSKQQFGDKLRFLKCARMSTLRLAWNKTDRTI